MMIDVYFFTDIIVRFLFRHSLVSDVYGGIIILYVQKSKWTKQINQNAEILLSKELVYVMSSVVTFWSAVSFS